MGTRERVLSRATPADHLGAMGDFWDVVTFKPVRDVAGDVVGSIPGLNDLVNGPLRDFARTPVGHAVLEAISGVVYGSTGGGLVPFLGPQLASIAFAIPGMLTGDDFGTAWMTGVRDRAEQTAQILGGDAANIFSQQLGDTLKKMVDDFGIDNAVQDSLQSLIDRYGIREDVAAFAKSLWNKIQVPSLDMFDPASGRSLGGAVMLQSAGVAPAMLARVDVWGTWSQENATLTTETAALANVPGFADYRTANAPSGYGAANTSPNRKSGDLLLGASILGAAAALWFYFKR